jgi:hypothetical protein
MTQNLDGCYQRKGRWHGPPIFNCSPRWSYTATNYNIFINYYIFDYKSQTTVQRRLRFSHSAKNIPLFALDGSLAKEKAPEINLRTKKDQINRSLLNPLDF